MVDIPYFHVIYMLHPYAVGIVKYYTSFYKLVIVVVSIFVVSCYFKTPVWVDVYYSDLYFIDIVSFVLCACKSKVFQHP